MDLNVIKSKGPIYCVECFLYNFIFNTYNVFFIGSDQI